MNLLWGQWKPHNGVLVPEGGTTTEARTLTPILKKIRTTPTGNQKAAMNLYRILVLLAFYTCSHWLSAQPMSMTYEDRVALAKVLRNGEEKAALSALETAIANKDYLVIGQGIGSMSWTIRVSATEAMLETKEKQFLPFLLSGYEGFQGALTGGDEMRGFQIEITQKLLHSMFQILHPDVSMPEVFGKEEEKRIIDEVKVIRSQMERSQANEEKKADSNSPPPYKAPEVPRKVVTAKLSKEAKIVTVNGTNEQPSSFLNIVYASLAGMLLVVILAYFISGRNQAK